MVVLAGEPTEVMVQGDGVATTSKAVKARAYAQPQVRLMGANLITAEATEIKTKVDGKGQAKKVQARKLGVAERDAEFFIPTDLLASKFADTVLEAEAVMFSEAGAQPMVLPPRRDGYKPEEV